MSLDDKDILKVKNKYKNKWQKEQLQIKRNMITNDELSFDVPELITKDVYTYKYKDIKRLKIKKDGKVLKKPLKYIGGVDISPIKSWHSDKDYACAGVIICEYPSLTIVHKEMKIIKLTQPYIAGFLAFRECNPLLNLINNIKKYYSKYIPQLIIVDGNGYLHYRRMGLASHFGVICGIPTIGVAKTLLQVERGMNSLNDEFNLKLFNIGDYKIIKSRNGEVLGAALKTTRIIKADNTESDYIVYVSTGHKISLDSALKLVYLSLDKQKRCRLPLPTEFADFYTREIMREYEDKTKFSNVSNESILNGINKRIKDENDRNYIKKFGEIENNEIKSDEIKYSFDDNDLIIFDDVNDKDVVTWSALCIIPPKSVWDPIQKIRKEHDKSYVRWMPHINLFFPFIKPNAIDFDKIKDAINKTFKKYDIKSKDITLKEFSCFGRGLESNKSQYVFLEPTNKDFLNDLYDSLRIVFPGCQRGDGSFTPHLTVGQWPGKKCMNVITKYNDEWNPISFKLDKIYWIQRAHDKPFEIYKEFELL